MPFPYDAILFDFDGVLVDSEPLHWACWRDTVAPLGIDLSWPRYAADFVGISDDDLALRLGLPPETLAAKRGLFRARAAASALVSDDVRRFLRGLPVPLAVVTSSARSEVEPVLAASGIQALFAACVYRESVPWLKPHPDPYLTAAAFVGATSPLVVEDSDIGVASAMAAGFDVVRIGRQSEMVAVVEAKLRGLG